MANTDKLTINTNIGISVDPETDFDVAYVLAAEFVGAETSAYNIQIPNLEYLIPSNMIGSGQEWGLSGSAVADYLSHSSISFSDRLNTSNFALLLKRFLSGDATSAEVGVSTSVYDHTLQQQTSDDDMQLESSTVAFKTGGIDPILSGMCVNNLQAGFQGGAAPTFSADLLGSGRVVWMADQTPALVLPAPTAQKYVGHAAQNFVTWNDGTLFDLTSLGLVRSLNLQMSNNLQSNDRRQGDPLLVSGNPDKGAVAGRLVRGTRSVSLSVVIYVDNGKRALLTNLNKTEVQDVKWKSVGGIIASTYRHEVEFTIPRAMVTASQIGEDGGRAIFNLTFEPLKHSSADGVIKARVRNGVSTIA